MASFKVKIDGLNKLAEKLKSPSLAALTEQVAQDKGVLALITQGIAENFENEGPGWAPLKAATIRGSLSVEHKKAIGEMSNEELLRHERKARLVGAEETPHRAILQKTGLLKKTVTTPGFAGSSEGKNPVSGKNIYRVEGHKIIWGTDLIYAGVHNKGSPKQGIPKREFLKLQPEILKEIYEFCVQKYKKIVKRAVTT